MTEPQSPANTLLTKDAATLAEYVHGAMEMETHHFTLLQITEKMFNDQKRFKEQSKQQMENASKAHTKAQGAHKNAKDLIDGYDYKRYLEGQKIHKQSRSTGQKVGSVIGAIFLHYFGGGFSMALGYGVLLGVIFLTCEILGIDVNTNSSAAIIAGIAGCILGLITWIILFFTIRTIRRRLDYKERKERHTQAEQDTRKALEIAERELQAAREKNKNSALAIQKMNEQITLLLAQSRKLSHNLDEYYRPNIIPPDYRNLSCLMLIDYVFRNDQADTMREATLLCDQRIRHEETLAALQELSETMRSIGVALNHIRQDIRDISYDMSTLVNNQELLIEETKASRYAAEAVQHSAHRLEWRMFLNKQ